MHDYLPNKSNKLIMESSKQIMLSLKFINNIWQVLSTPNTSKQTRSKSTTS
jgi:hypothetical protein